MGGEDVISIIEQAGENGWTKVMAATRAEFDRAAQEPKSSNPLH
jgi:hypothetical protein